MQGTGGTGGLGLCVVGQGQDRQLLSQRICAQGRYQVSDKGRGKGK